MDVHTTWALRCFGICGILGAVGLICGDLLYNHIPGSTASPAAKMSRMPESRLLNAGTLGLIGCWFYVVAAWHIYLAFRPAGEIFAAILLIAFGAVMVCYGITHTAYFAIAAGARVAKNLGGDAEQGGKLGNVFFNRLVTITYFPVAIATIMMAYGMISGHSLYPLWMVLFLPIIIYLIKTPVVRILKGQLRELVNDSYDNIVLFVFFSISTVVLWNAAVI